MVLCKSWRWAALVYAAFRIAGQACDNTIRPLEAECVLEDDSAEQTGGTEAFLSLAAKTIACFGDRDILRHAFVELQPNDPASGAQCEEATYGVARDLQEIRNAHASAVQQLLKPVAPPPPPPPSSSSCNSKASQASVAAEPASKRLRAASSSMLAGPYGSSSASGSALF